MCCFATVNTISASRGSSLYSMYLLTAARINAKYLWYIVFIVIKCIPIQNEDLQKNSSVLTKYMNIYCVSCANIAQCSMLMRSHFVVLQGVPRGLWY